MAGNSAGLPETAGKAGTDYRGGVPRDPAGGAYAPECASSSLCRAAASGCSAAAAVASLPLLACTGSWGSGTSSGVPLAISASAAAISSSPKSASDAESAADFPSPAGADGEYQASKRLAAAANVMARDPAALQLRLLQTVVEVAAEKNSTLVMPVPVELLRFFDKLTPPAPAGGMKSAADSASLADFGNEDVAAEEAEIQSGAPLQIPRVPPIPTLPMQVGNVELAAAAVAGHNGDAASGA